MAAIENPKAVDIHAIQKALQSIRLKSPTLASNLDAGASSSMTSLSYATHAATNTALNHIIAVQFSPRQQKNQQQQHYYTTHGIIPSGPLTAFRRTTSKAQVASANLSRSATLSEAVLRLWPIISFQRKMRMIDQGLLLPPQQPQQQQQVNRKSNIFTIHILGADGVECTSLESVRKSVGPFVRWFDSALSLGVLSESNDIDTLQIEFSGPNISTTLVGQTLDILVQQSSSCAPLSTSSRLIMAKATFQPCQYHEIKRSANIEGTPIADIAIAFNAGIWGYDSWKPTVVSLINTPSPVTGNGKTLFVITSYTMEECEDDADVIADVVKDVISKQLSPHATTNLIIARQLWIEDNPFSSRVERQTESAPPGRKYFENSAWQAWLLG